MYGTIARIRLKPGAEEHLWRLIRENSPRIDGIVFQHVYRMDADPRECFLVVGFTSKEHYRRNAESSEQHARYLRFRELLESDPEWHDGEIVFSLPE